MSFRSFLYAWARLLGDSNAVGRAIKTGSPKPIVQRIERRLIGRLFSRLMNMIVRVSHGY